MIALPVAAVISTVHLEGDVTADGGDFVDVPFDVPAGTVEVQIARTYTPAADILDFGVWHGLEFRGWSGGLTDDIVVGVAQSTRGYLPGPIAADTWTLVIGKAKLDLPAHYSVDVTFRDDATLTVLPTAAYEPVVLETGERWYRGDFHVHSTQSGDASATPDADVTLAAQRGLDFIHMSDHNTVSQLGLSAASQPAWPVLVLRGSEITTYSGHGNGIGISSYVDHRLGYNGRTIADVVADVKAQGGIFLVNHPATDLGADCIGCPWGHVDDTPWDDVAGLEVLTAGWEIGVEVFTPNVLELWDSLEDQGHRLAAVGGSDDHSAGVDEGGTGAPVGSPCVSVLAPELSEAAILAGVKARHTIVQLRGCDDPVVDVRLGDAQVGDEVEGVSDAAFTARVTKGDGTHLSVWKDGKVLEQQDVVGDDVTLTFHDTPGAEKHRYRFELVDGANRRLVITSHFYVDGVAGGGGGCSAGRGRASWPVGAMLGLLALRRRSRRGPARVLR